MKGLSKRILQYMPKFAEEWPIDIKVPQAAAQIQGTDSQEVQLRYRLWHNFKLLRTRVTAEYRGDKVELKKRWMKKRWGSCNSQGQITLNMELIEASKNVLNMY